jgi:hypothetical protein
MKHFTLTTVCIALSFFMMAQNKKPVTTKKITNDSASNTVLKQEKIWPGFGKNTKNATTVIKPPAVVNTWNKL